MTSLVAEIPGYLQGRNPMSIEAVTRRLAKILQLPLDLGRCGPRAPNGNWKYRGWWKRTRKWPKRCGGWKRPTTTNFSG